MGVSYVMWGGRRLSRTGAAALAATVGLAGAASAAYQVSSRRSAHAVVTPHAPAVVTLTASVEPAAVVYGASVRLRGVVRDGAGTGLAGQSVEAVLARVDAPESPAVVGSAVSDAQGRVSVVFRPAAGSSAWLRFAGGQPAPSSAAVPLAVAPKVTVRAASRAAGGAWATRFTGTVEPAQGGQVVLERRTGSRWRRAAAGPVSAAGTYTLTARDAAGRHAYRVVAPTAGAYAAGTASYDLRLGRLPAKPARPAPPVAPVRPVRGRLLVAGDSLAFYLGKQLGAARGARPTGLESRHSSGLARQEYFDWVGFARREVASSAPGGVVLFLGGNDCQPIRAGWTGRWTSVGTAAWAAEYRRRAAELMRAFGSDGARPVYWIGLPIAKKPDIASCYRMLNAATVAAAREVRGVTWVDSWSVYAVNGRYSATVDGVVARQDDGIHLTFEGTRLLTRKVLPLVGG